MLWVLNIFPTLRLTDYKAGPISRGCKTITFSVDHRLLKNYTLHVMSRIFIGFIINLHGSLSLLFFIIHKKFFFKLIFQVFPTLYHLNLDKIQFLTIVYQIRLVINIA